MYESFYGFRDTPFRLSADEKFRYTHKNYLRASAYLAYALQQSEGFVMITGQPGSGKTTLVRDVISEIDETKFNALNLVTSQLQAEELLRKVALEYGLPAESFNKATLLTAINRHLSDLYDRGQRSILFLDEAQNLSVNGLEELRLLSNLQKGNSSLLQIVLIGHDELRELVLGPDMEHIRQRLIATCQIKPMSADQTKEYIEHRLGVVGWQADPDLDEDVYELIHQAAQGVPRNINHLMNRLLLFASLEEKHKLNGDDALVIIAEMIEDQRISLANEESYESFAERYQIKKVQQLDNRQVRHKKAAVHDIFSNKSLQQQLPNQVEIDEQQELIANTNYITKNLLAAIDASAQDVEEAWDLPDSDWGSWESDLTIKREFLSAVADAEDSDYSDFLEAGVESKEEEDRPLAEKERSVVLPSADEIWNNELDSVVMDSLISESKKQLKPQAAPLNDTPKKSQKETQIPSLEDEHRWGGVWWMSSESRDAASVSINSSKDRDKTLSGQPNWSNEAAKNRIVVEENLSMPSMWVEGCPAAVSKDPSQLIGNKPQSNKLASSVLRVASWVGIGLLVMFVYYMFSNQINSFSNTIVERINGVESLSGPLSEADRFLNSAPVTEPQSLINENESSNIQESVASIGYLQDAPAYSDDGYIGASEYIDLAKRYSVFFDFNKTTIPSDYIPLLKSVQLKMLKDENNFLRIIGYADTQGSSDYNYRLSLRRADEVKQFFVKRGIAGERLHVTAVGSADEARSTYLNRDESAKRRRVEMIVFPSNSVY